MDEKLKEILNQYAANKGTRIGLDDWAVQEIKKLFTTPKPVKREESTTQPLFNE